MEIMAGCITNATIKRHKWGIKPKDVAVCALYRQQQQQKPTNSVEFM